MKNECKQHGAHDHRHDARCGHMAVIHDGHTDYLHEGHLHHLHESHIDEHSISVNKTNPAACTPQHSCSHHDGKHTHGPNCGHERAPHGDHIDYVVGGHLHHDHGGHCDDHGPVRLAA